jgi:hypothetical protein
MSKMVMGFIKLAIRTVSLWIKWPEYEVHPPTSIMLRVHPPTSVMLRPIAYRPLPPCLSMASLLGAEVYAQPYL